MIYLDTSAIAPFYWPEALSTMVVDALRQESERVLSDLTVVELYSALSRRVRLGEITQNDAQQIVNQVQVHLQSNFYQTKSLSSRHYQQAQRWLVQFNTPLRTLDALHLALASAQKCVLLTADIALARSAEILEVPVRLLSVAS